MTACDCSYRHYQLLGSSVKPHTHKCTRPSLPLSCHLFGLQVRAPLTSPGLNVAALQKLHPSKASVVHMACWYLGPQAKTFHLGLWEEHRSGLIKHTGR